MGDQYSKSKYLYFSDDGGVYVVGLRDEKADTGGFLPAPTAVVLNFPKTYRMRYVVGVDLNTGAKHVQPVAEAGNSLFVNATQFTYLGVSFHVLAHVAEKRHGKY